MADDAGPLLVREGLVQAEQMKTARLSQAAHGGTVGEHLVRHGFIDDEALTNFYRTRLMLPRVDPRKLQRIPESVVQRVPPDMAVEFRIMPIAVDADQNLVLAMSDPSNSHAVDEIHFFTGHFVVRAVATQSEIAWCLHHYYKHTGSSQSAVRPPPIPTGPPQTGEQESRRRVLPPMSSPPAPTGRAVRVSEMIPALRHAKQEAAHQAVARGHSEQHQHALPGLPPTSAAHHPTLVGADPSAALRSYERPTLPQLTVPEGSEDDTRPIMRAMPPRERRSNEPPRSASGEVDSGGGDDYSDADRLPAVVLGNIEGTDSAPILLDRPKAPTTPPDSGSPTIVDTPRTVIVEANDSQPAAKPTGGDDVVLLETPKRKRRPSATRMGLGFADGEQPPNDSPEAADSAKKTAAMATVRREIPNSPPTTEPAPTAGASTDNSSADVDDGWGDSDSIPPFVAKLAAAETTATSVPTPIAPEQSEGAKLEVQAAAQQQPLGVAQAKPVATTTASTQITDASSDPAFDSSVRRLSGTLRALKNTGTRDEVIQLLLMHLASSCQRAAFFVVRKGALRGWAALGPGTDAADLDNADLPLDTPSTFQDIVATRLPFRGPVRDPASQNFLANGVGTHPVDMVALPVCVRDKVVGILYGDDRRLPLYEEHLNSLVRHGGLALERILRTGKK